MSTLVAVLLLAIVSLIYATVGQAGGTAFLAVMAVTGVPAAELRPTALVLNILAAGYASWRLQARQEIELSLLLRIGLPSLPASFLGGTIALDSALYYALTGGVLVAAALAMLGKWTTSDDAGPPSLPVAVLLGAGAGFVSGLTGVGGGVFVAPAVILLGWVTATQVAGLTAPFILLNSMTGLAGALVAGQHVSEDLGFFALAALAGAIAGTIIGRGFLSEMATRRLLAAILVFAGIRLLLH